jgi:hypothetical protein
MNRTNFFATHLLSVSRWVFLGFLFLFPLFFLPFTLDPIEINKQSLLLVSVSVASLILVGSILLKKEWNVRFGWSLVFPLALVVFSEFLRINQYLHFNRGWGTMVLNIQAYSHLSGCLFCFIFVRYSESSFSITYTLVVSSCKYGVERIVRCVISVWYFCISFFPALNSSVFNTIGTYNTLALFMIVMSLLFLSIFISKQERWFVKSWQNKVVYFFVGLVFS